MNAVGLAVFCLVAAACAQHPDHDHRDHAAHEQHRVNVSVYYESLCPDSKKFIVQQLYKTLLGNLSNYINLTLVPYGKSTTTQELQEFKFTCHHGPAECEGNKLQACAIHTINNGANDPGMGFSKVTAGFVACMMDKSQNNGNKTSFPTEACATDSNVPNLAAIQNCANHVEGSKLLADLGKKTNQLQNPLKSVPTVVFNDKYVEADSQLAQTDFAQALCQHIPKDKPRECSKSSANALYGFALMYLLVAAITRLAN